jgi:hypothetical protein
LTRFLPSRRVAAALALLLALAAPGVAGAQGGDPYRQHMENGVKLYADRNFAAALAEFQAAYDAKPGPNPLVNVALCDKEMFRYPQAIAALEAALAKHGTAMDAADRKAAEDAIKEMRALLGSVTVTLTPPGAKLFVDGEELPPGAAGKPVFLGPGKHKIAARAEGHVPAEQSIDVSSGRDQAVALALVPDKGVVTIEAPDPRAILSVDNRPLGTGTWTGFLDPGTHVVQMLVPGGQPYNMSILVTPGVPLQVRKGEGGTPILPPQPEETRRRGFYALAIGSMLFAGTHPPNFPGPLQLPDYGAAYGLRVGFQVNDIAGFEASFEHSSIYTYQQQTDATSTVPVNYYRIIANRFALGLRIISSGKLVRFVGSFGGGFVADDMSVNKLSALGTTTCANPTNGNNTCYFFGTGDHPGIDAFALAEAGAELDLDHVLVDFVAEGQLQSTGNITGVNQRPIFGALPLINGGPAIRIGYRFW